VDLPMAVEAAYFRQPDNQFHVVLAAKIPGSAVSFLQKSVTPRTEFDFVWRATDSAGRQVAVLRDNLPVKLDADTYRQVLSGNILYEGGFELPAGNYHLKVVARENESGKLGTFEVPLVLPDAAGSGLALSSVVVSNQLQESAREGEGGGRKAKGRNTNPLQVGSRLLLPSVTRVFRTNQNLYVYLESYEGKAKSEGGSKGNGTDQTSESRSAGGGESNPPPSVALVFFRSGVQISEAGPFVGKLENASKATTMKVAYFVQIPLEEFPPGRYMMQINVLVPSSDRAAFVRVPIAITGAQLKAIAEKSGSQLPAQRPQF